MQTAVLKIRRATPCKVTHDLEIALTGSGPQKTAVLVLSEPARVVSENVGRTHGQDGRVGHIRDKGSGFEIGLRALKAVVFYFDRDGTWSRLGESLLTATGTNEPDDLIDCGQRDKHAVAALAPEVFAAAKKRDRIARDILEGAAGMLAKDAELRTQIGTKISPFTLCWPAACCAVNRPLPAKSANPSRALASGHRASAETRRRLGRD